MTQRAGQSFLIGAVALCVGLAGGTVLTSVANSSGSDATYHQLAVFAEALHIIRATHVQPASTVKLIEAVSHGVPKALSELITLGRTLKQRAEDVLAYFDRPGTSNGPTEAINGRLEHLRGSALGFRNLTNYIARSLLESDGFRPRLHPSL